MKNTLNALSIGVENALIDSRNIRSKIRPRRSVALQGGVAL